MRTDNRITDNTGEQVGTEGRRQWAEDGDQKSDGTAVEQHFGRPQRGT